MDGYMSPFLSPSGIRKSEHVVHEHEHEPTPAPSSLARQIAYGIVSRQAAHSRPWRSGMSVCLESKGTDTCEGSKKDW